MLPTDLDTLRQRLSHEVAGKTRLYLDTGFWAAFCDLEMGIVADTKTREVLFELRRRVSAGTLICPVGEHLLNELFRQRLPAKRAATATLMDELSGKIAFLQSQDRIAWEVLGFLRIDGRRDPRELRVPGAALWTRPVFAFGHFSLAGADVPKAFAPLLARLALKELWNVSIHDIATREELPTDPGAPFNGVHEDLNKLKRTNRERFRSFKQQYLNEIHGACEAYEHVLRQAILQRFKEAGGDPSTLQPTELDASAKTVSRLIRAAFARRGPLMEQVLPSLHVLATLYARVDWDTSRNYRTGDVADFGHAAAAIPYCDALATDRALAKLLHDSGLSAQFPCRVVDSMEQLQALLGNLDAPPSASGT